MLQILKRQPPGGGHRLAVPARLTPAQQVRPPLPEQAQVPGYAVPAGLDVSGGLLQRQRQPTQRVGQVPGRLPVRIAGAVSQETRGDPDIEHLHLQRLPARPKRTLARDQHPPRSGRWQELLHRCPVRRVVENQQPLARERREYSVHRRHRIPDISDIPGPELGCQLTEPVSQHRRSLGGQLPGHPDLGQVTVRVRQRHAGLPGTSKPAQGHSPRHRTIATGQPGMQVSEQILAPGQQRRRVGQPHRLAGDPWALLHHLTYRGPAAVGVDRARPPVPTGLG